MYLTCFEFMSIKNAEGCWDVTNKPQLKQFRTVLIMFMFTNKYTNRKMLEDEMNSSSTYQYIKKELLFLKTNLNLLLVWLQV